MTSDPGSPAADILAATTALVARFAPNQPDPATLAPDLELVRDLGFDSVRLVELLLTVDETFAVTLPMDAILGGDAMSIAGLAAEVERARATA